jgi:hypothetical protein
MTSYVTNVFANPGENEMDKRKRYKVYWERAGEKVVQYFDDYGVMHNEMIQEFGRLVVDRFPENPLRPGSEIGASVNLCQSTGSTFASTSLKAIVYVIKEGVDENHDPEIAPQNTGEC